MKTIQRTITIISVIVMVLSSSFTVSIRTSSINIKENEDNNIKLNGSIIVEITDDYLGAVFPLINLSSNEVLNCNVSTMNTDSYQVNYTLRIDIEEKGKFNESYPFGRYLTTLVLVSRENSSSQESSILRRDLILNRLTWFIKRFNLVNSGEKFIEIPIKYETNLPSENITIHIFTLGSLTGFLANGKIVFDRKIVNLKILHNLPLVGQYSLAISSTGDGTGNIEFSPAGSYNLGDIVTLWANATLGSTFIGWGGDLSGTNSPETLIMDDNKTVTAEFALNQYSLTSSNEGNGYVTKDPDQATYGYGSNVVLNAVADPGWTFDYWDGDLSGNENPKSILMDSNKVVTAHFSKCQYTLTVNTEGQGTVTKYPDQQTYAYGTIVALIANPDNGWIFDYWSGDLSGSDNPETIVMDSDKVVTANFSLFDTIPPVTEIYIEEIE